MSKTTAAELPTMPDVVAAGIRWAAAQAEFNAAANTLDDERIDRAMDAYEATIAEFNAAVLGYAQRLPAYRDLLEACREALPVLDDEAERREQTGDAEYHHPVWEAAEMLRAAIAKATRP